MTVAEAQHLSIRCPYDPEDKEDSDNKNSEDSEGGEESEDSEDSKGSKDSVVRTKNSNMDAPHSLLRSLRNIMYKP